MESDSIYSKFMAVVTSGCEGDLVMVVERKLAL
jgi:hypothetical protein